MNLLYLLPNFNYSAAGRQVTLLAPKLHGCNVQVAGLGVEGPISSQLQAAGISVRALGVGQRWNIGTLWNLRRLLVEFRPDVIHAWRLPALRAIGFLTSLRRRQYRLVVSEPWRGGRQTKLDRRWLRLADTVVGNCQADSAAIRKYRPPAQSYCEIPLAVTKTGIGNSAMEIQLPHEARILMCIGSLTRPHGFRDAIWTANILHYIMPDLHLVLIGDGPERARLAQFSRDFKPDCRHVHFLPGRPDAASLLAHAEVLLVPSLTDCGRQVLVEAQAAGRPVVASAGGGLADLVADGETGLLSPPADTNAMTTRTRRLLDDRAFAARLSQAAQVSVADRTPDRIAPRYAELYARR